MKKIIFLSVIFIATLCILTGEAELANAASSDYTYTVADNEATVTGLAEYITDDLFITGELKIPIRLGGYPVKHIGENAFSHYQFITSVEIPAYVTSIGSFAFEDCSSLEEVIIPKSVTSIESYAFSNCLMLEKVIIPETTVNFGDGVFYGSPKLLSAGPIGGDYNIQFSWTTHVPANALSNSFIETMVFPSTVTSIGDTAFFGCENLKHIDIPKTVTDLGYQTFAYCSSLESIEIPDGVTQLRGHVFRECTSLTYIKIPQSVTEMGGDNFSKCNKLLTAGPINGDYNIEFYWNEEIPANAFSDAEITKVVIPEGVTRISNNAFQFCRNLYDVTLPSTIESTELSGLDLRKIKTAGPVGGEYDLKISSTNLTYNIIGVFEYLTEIVVPNTTTTIGTQAFYEMACLEKVTLNKNITSIASDAFSKSNNSVTLYVYEHSYAHKYAAIYKKNCFIMDKNEAFYALEHLSISINDDNQAIITDCYGIYKGSLTIPDVIYGFPVVEIDTTAFNTCLDMTAITIPSCVTSIGDYAFENCRKLEEINIPNSVTQIGEFAFKDCHSLERISIPNNITNLETGIFYGCKSLKYVNLPTNLETIGVNAFANCSALENIYLSETITQIRGGAFSDCTSLTYIELPSNITTIGDGTFFDCQNLADVVIPDKVTSIGDSAFFHCYCFSKIIIPKSVTSIYHNAFVGCTNTFYVYTGTYGETFAANKKHELIKETENLHYYFNDDMTVIIGARTKNQDSLDIAKELKGVDCPRIKIEYGAFRDCSKLKNITIPAEVSIIGNKAFYGCTALTDVYFLESKTKWNKIHIGIDNTNLISSVLHYSTPIETNISDDGETFTIRIENAEKSNLVILALYFNDELVNLYSSTYQGEDIVFNDVKETYDKVKVMVWDTLMPLYPVDLIV